MCADWYDYLTVPSKFDEILPTLNTEEILSYLRQFLSQACHADASLQNRKTDDNKEIRQQSKKSEFLDLFALKLLCALKFNLSVLCSPEIALCLALQGRLLRNLLRITADSPGLDPYQDIEWPGWSPVSRFSHLLYHKWCLTIILQRAFIRKPDRVNLMNAPLIAGLSEIPDSFFLSESLNEFDYIKNRVGESIHILEQLANSSADFSQPIPNCFHYPDLREPARHDFSSSILLNPSQVKASIYFNLGRCKMQTDALSAEELFMKVKACLRDCSHDGLPLDVSHDLLSAYLTACSSMHPNRPISATLRQKVDSLKSQGYANVGFLLMTDLIEWIRDVSAGPQIGLTIRERVEYFCKKEAEQSGGKDQKRYYFEVATCNILERVIFGHALLTNYLALLESLPASSVFECLNYLLAQIALCFSALVNQSYTSQRSNLKCFVWFLCQSLPEDFAFVNQLLGSEVANYLSDVEISTLKEWYEQFQSVEDSLKIEDLEDFGIDNDDENFPGGLGGERQSTAIESEASTLSSLSKQSTDIFQSETGQRELEMAEDDWFDDDDEEDEEVPFPTSDISGPGVGLWNSKSSERNSDCYRLLASYDPEEIDTLVKRLGRGSMWNRHALMSLSDKWRVPPPLAKLLNNAQTSLDQVYAYILIAKSQILKSMEDWRNARLLLNSAETVLKDSYRLNKMIKNEITLIDIQEYLLFRDSNRSQTSVDLIGRCKTCITQMRLDGDCLPTEELLIACTCLLITSKDIEYLLEATSGYSGPCEFGRLLVTAFRDCSSAATASKTQSAAKELWDYLVKCLLPRRLPSGQLANNSGVITRIQLIDFIRLLPSVNELDVIIAALVHMTSLIRNDISLINPHSPFKDVWPSNLPPNAQMHTLALCDTLKTVLECGLRISPQRVGWMILLGDLAAADLHHSSALKIYLECGSSVSEFFTKPVPPDVYTERVVNQMIKCCQELRLYGEAVVLCQLVSQINTAAQIIKDLSDPADNLDSFVPFIWDVNLLEIMTAHETRRGALTKRAKLIQAIGQPEVNANNRSDILQTCELRKKSEFLRIMAEHHIL